MLKPMLVAGLQQGGQLMITTDVENYPGFADAIQGPWLMEQMLAQAEHVGTDIINDIITEVDLKRRPFRPRAIPAPTYTADALIIATGAQAKWLGIPTEQTFIGLRRLGLRHLRRLLLSRQGCRRDRRRQYGGGRSALSSTNFAEKVTVIHRRNDFRAERILRERLLKKAMSASSGTRWSTRSPAAPRRRCRPRRRAEQARDRRETI